MNNSRTVGTTIKQLRLSYGYTQAQLAELAGLHDKHISKIERGTQPTVETLEKILSVFGKSISEVGLNLERLKIKKRASEYVSALKILNSANDKEIKYYYNALKSAQIGLKIIK